MIKDELRLDGKVALVVGLGDRGKALALGLAEAGADIAVAAPLRRAGEIEETISGVHKLGRRAIAEPTDVTRSTEVRALVDRVLAELGHIDILVNNCLNPMAKPLLETSHEEWHRALDMNLTSVFLCCKEVGRHMLAQGRGRIINIISGLAEKGMANATVLAASQGGVLQFSRALALEWGQHNIRVSCVGLGWFGPSGEGDQAKDPMARYTPMKRRGTPEDMLGLVVYLASDAADFVTGHMHLVDGGLLARA